MCETYNTRIHVHICSLGIPGLITADMVREGAAVIDIGEH